MNSKTMIDHIYKNKKTKVLYLTIEHVKLLDKTSTKWINGIKYRCLNEKFNEIYVRTEKDFLSKFTIEGH